MGKKRRLLHSKKFVRKHDNHPRMKMLNPATPAVIEEPVVETTTTLNLQAIADEIMAEDPVVEERPPVPKPMTRKVKATPKKKTQKVAASAPPKTTTKTTTTKKSPAKKTTTTRKRSTRTKTKTATA